MSVSFHVTQVAQRLVDLGYRVLPRPKPSLSALQNCKIISHRGEHDNRRVKENTLAAFAPVAEAGVWGIELDVRWTRDLQPVVIHDADTRRVFGIDLAVADVELHQLQQQVPEIPTLTQVVADFGGSTHLMIELKPDRLAADAIKAERLQEICAPLKPALDYHFLALQPDLLAPVAFAGGRACLLVAELSIKAFSQQALNLDLAGLCGQYLLLNDRLIKRHHAAGQRLGSGFASSRYCFYRELNRGIDWIFTNHALQLLVLRRRLLGD